MLNFKKLAFSLTLLGLVSVTHAIAMDNKEEGLDSKTLRVPSQLNYQDLKTVGESSYVF